MEKGSILVLTLVGVLVLSFMATGLLTVGTTELNTTLNFYLNKSAYYEAVKGVEEVRNLIFNDPDVEIVDDICKSVSGTKVIEDGIDRSYITGSLLNWEENEPQNLRQFDGFDAPQFPGMALENQQYLPVIWKVHVTAEVSTGIRKGYSEIVVGVYSIIDLGKN